jgi:hypothetical protein
MYIDGFAGSMASCECSTSESPVHREHTQHSAFARESRRDIGACECIPMGPQRRHADEFVNS